VGPADVTPVHVRYPDATDPRIRIVADGCQIRVRPGEGEEWVSGTYQDPSGQRSAKLDELRRGAYWRFGDERERDFGNSWVWMPDLVDALVRPRGPGFYVRQPVSGDFTYAPLQDALVGVGEFLHRRGLAPVGPAPCGLPRSREPVRARLLTGRRRSPGPRLGPSATGCRCARGRRRREPPRWSRVKDRGRLLHRVVGGKPGIGQSRHILRADLRVQPDDCPCTGLQQLGEPPSASMPGNAPLAQCMSLPARHARQNPHLTSGWTITVSPTATFSTAGPTACTQPAFSCPRVYGKATLPLH
jgi:hypothetical protein